MSYAFVVILVAASIGGGAWAGLSYSRSRISEYMSETDRLRSELEALQGDMESLQGAIIELRSKNDELREKLRLLSPSWMETEPVDLSGAGTEKIAFASYYRPEPSDVVPQVEGYDLPLNPSDISNFQGFYGKIPLSQGALELLGENGFIVIENPVNPVEEDITRPYEELKDMDVPVFITTDSLLHLYHIQFGETLRQIEEGEFYDDIWDLSEALLEDSVAKYNRSSGDLREASKRNAAYFSVALSLLKPRQDQVCRDEEMFEDPGSFKPEDIAAYSFDVPGFVDSLVEEELGLIEGHEGFAQSPIFVYNEDYSQYVPRGHYTRSEKLRNYFRALMWYGRMSLLLKGSDQIKEGETCSFFPPCDALISTYDAKIQTMQACLTASRFAESPELKVKWDRVYAVTSFYVGFSDDLGPDEYIEAMNDVFSGFFDLNDLTEEAIGVLKAKLAEYRPPEIYGGTGEIGILPPLTPEQADEILEATKGFRMMGQRLVPDSYMFQNLVTPKVGRSLGSDSAFTLVMTLVGPARGFPRGLDIMALLGSDRAAELLDELKDSNYENYSAQFDLLREEFEALNETDWNKNLYWSWLHTLRPLLKEFGEGYPTFMQTQAWRDKELTTALASWAELRHDTILYAKQSYTPEVVGIPIKEPIVGYVEPVPEFYGRLLSLTRMTKEGLEDMGVLDRVARGRLERLEEILVRLVDISERELRNGELSQEDYDFIRDFGEGLEDVVEGVDERGKRTTIVADVHTDQNTKRVLEEAVGYVRLMVVAYRVPDGRILLGAGPVMSYYEFKHPMEDRLTDEAWRGMLASSPPENPEWVPNFTR